MVYIGENGIKMDDLGVPPFMETTIFRDIMECIGIYRDIIVEYTGMQWTMQGGLWLADTVRYNGDYLDKL